MAGSVAPRDWEALEMAAMIGQYGQITVTGEVELTDTGTTAELKERTPGINPKILLLDLVVHRPGGIQGHIAWFETLTFKKKSSGNAYDEVDILYGGVIVQRVKVEHPLTFAAKNKTAKKAAKKRAAKTPKKSTKKSVKKPTKKKSANKKK